MLYLLYRIRPTIVRLGELDMNTDDDSAVDYKISAIINHPKHIRKYDYFDIALLKLETKIKINKFIRPACLYNKAQIYQSKALATGWGHTAYGATKLNPQLLKALLEIYDNKKCALIYKTNKRIPNGITDNMLCAGDSKGTNDTCQGDSGGPLIISPKGKHCKFFLIGVTSFGKGCGTVPSLYTKISDFVPWIEETIW